MRAVFTIRLPRVGGDYPDDSALLKVFEMSGWSFRNVEMMTQEDMRAIVKVHREDPVPSQIPFEDWSLVPVGMSIGTLGDDDSRSQYAKLAAVLFEEMPEVAAVERSSVVYLGYIGSEQAPLVLTRMIAGEMTFRLLNGELSRLQASTEEVIAAILTSSFGGAPLATSIPTVRDYERNLDHVIITGRVITSPSREALRANPLDAILFSVGMFLFFMTLVGLLAVSTGVSPVWYGTLERLNTALLVMALVGVLGIVTTWWNIRRSKRIDWSVHRQLGQPQNLDHCEPITKLRATRPEESGLMVGFGQRAD